MAGWQQSLLQVANDKGVRFNKQSPYFKYIGSSRNDVYNWKRNDVFNCKALLQLIIACVLNNLTAFPENMKKDVFRRRQGCSRVNMKWQVWIISGSNFLAELVLNRQCNCRSHASLNLEILKENKWKRRVFFWKLGASVPEFVFFFKLIIIFFGDLFTYDRYWINTMSPWITCISFFVYRWKCLEWTVF